MREWREDGEGVLLATFENAGSRAFRSGFYRPGLGGRGLRGCCNRFLGHSREFVFFFEFLARFDRDVFVLRLVTAFRQTDLVRTCRNFYRLLRIFDFVVVDFDFIARGRALDENFALSGWRRRFGRGRRAGRRFGRRR